MSKVAASPRIVQTPGEAPAAPAEPKPDAFEAVALQTGMEGDSEPSEVDRLRAMVEAQGAQMANMMAAMQNMLRSQQGSKPGAPAPASALPDQGDVDMATLEAPVLTRQGWLVPPDYGMSPEKKRELEDQSLMRAAMQKIAEKA